MQHGYRKPEKHEKNPWKQAHTQRPEKHMAVIEHMPVVEPWKPKKKPEPNISGPGQVSLNKISGFSDLEKPKKFGSGQVLDFRRFLHNLWNQSL